MSCCVQDKRILIVVHADLESLDQRHGLRGELTAEPQRFNNFPRSSTTVMAAVLILTFGQILILMG